MAAQKKIKLKSTFMHYDFKSSKMMSSISVMIADTVFSLVVESVFLVQAKICSFLPIKFIGRSTQISDS